MVWAYLRVFVFGFILIGQSHGMLSRRAAYGFEPLETIYEEEPVRDKLPPLPESAVLAGGPDVDGNFQSTQDLFDYVKRNPTFVGSGHIIGRRFVYEVKRGKHALDICIRA